MSLCIYLNDKIVLQTLFSYRIDWWRRYISYFLTFYIAGHFIVSIVPYRKGPSLQAYISYRISSRIFFFFFFHHIAPHRAYCHCRGGPFVPGPRACILRTHKDSLLRLPTLSVSLPFSFALQHLAATLLFLCATISGTILSLKHPFPSPFLVHLFPSAPAPSPMLSLYAPECYIVPCLCNAPLAVPKFFLPNPFPPGS